MTIFILLTKCFESGTIMTPLILALNSGIKFVEKNFNKNNKKVETITQYLLSKLTALQNKEIVKLYSPIFVKYGVVAFNIVGLDSVEASAILDQKFNIAVRGGLHCAPLTHKFLGTTQIGCIRVSLNFKNSKKEINNFISALKKICIKKYH